MPKNREFGKPELNGDRGRLVYEMPARNRRQSLVITFPDPTGTSEFPLDPDPDGIEGEYEVTYIFSVPGGNQYLTDFKELETLGNSQIALPGEAKVTATYGPGVPPIEFCLFPNSDGKLARATVKVAATTFGHADVISYDLVSPLLSILSFKCDCGLEICARHLKEIATHSIKVTFFSVGATQELPFDIKTKFLLDPIDPELSPLLATYREAMNSINPFYQFFSFYKVTEGVKKLRPLRNKKAKAKGEDIREPTGERFATSVSELNVDEDDQPFFVPYLGKTFGFVRDKMCEVLRNAVAHLDVNSSSTPDSLSDLNDCEAAIPVIKFMARKLLDNELERDRLAFEAERTNKQLKS